MRKELILLLIGFCNSLEVSFADSLQITDSEIYKPKFLQHLSEVKKRYDQSQKTLKETCEDWNAGQTVTLQKSEVEIWEKRVSTCRNELYSMEKIMNELEIAWARVSPRENFKSRKKYNQQIDLLNRYISDSKNKILIVSFGVETQKYLLEKEELKKQNQKSDQEKVKNKKGFIDSAKDKIASVLNNLEMTKLSSYFSNNPSASSTRMDTSTLFTQKKMEYLKIMIKHQKDIFGEYPRNLQELGTPEVIGVLGGSYSPLKDGWGRDFRYQSSGENSTLTSAGKDGVFDNIDDLTIGLKQDSPASQ